MRADLTPHRQFNGNAKQAMEFYQTVFGGELQMMPFSTVHGEDIAGQGEKIMHAELIVEGRKLIFASDMPAVMERTKGEDTPLSLTGGPDLEEELRGYWDLLSEGATVTMPLDASPWGAIYGALEDKFGTHWMFNIGG